MDQADPSAENVLNFLFSMNSTVYVQNPKLSEDVLRQKYLQEQRTIREIAAEFMCSKSKVSQHLYRYGIKARKRRNAELVAPKPAYGETRRGNKLVKNHAEQKVIELMLQLNRSGSSFREIARRLNELDIPTKQRGAKWHHYVVGEIIKRRHRNE